jgi:hypothetical protein
MQKNILKQKYEFGDLKGFTLLQPCARKYFKTKLGFGDLKGGTPLTNGGESTLD